jgi:hypothetical protein
MARLLIACVAVWAVAAGCAGKTDDPRRGTNHPVHVVVCWLKSPGDEEARQKIIDVSRSFDEIPGVVKVAAGRAIPSDRPVVDDSFDVAIVMAFRDERALRAYNDHPAHKKAVEGTLKPLVGKLVIYDFLDR